MGNDDAGDARVVCKDAIDAVGKREQVFKLNVGAAYIDNLPDLDICKLPDLRYCLLLGLCLLCTLPHWLGWHRSPRLSRPWIAPIPAEALY
jgi:hypothetical protein